MKKNYITSSCFLIIITVFMTLTLKNIYNSSNKNISSLVKITEDVLQSNVGLKTKMITLNGGFQNLINKDYIPDVNPSYSVVKLNNSYLSWAYKYVDMTSQINDTLKFNSFLNENNIDFLMIQMPFKIDKNDSKLPNGIVDYSNKIADEFTNALKNNSIDVLDLRDEIHKQNLNHYELFFKTDHHWKPEAALWASKVTADYLGLDSSIYEAQNYDTKVYKNWFLGSQGKRVGPLYCEVDDISLITPKFPTNFTFKLPHKNISRTGEFKDVMFDYSLINNKDLFNLNPYAAYTGGDFPLNIIINNDNSDEKNVLLIRDSFSCTFAPFLSLSTKSLHIIDLRYYDNNLKNYITNNNIDLVIMAYNPSAYQDSIKKFNKLNN